MNRHFEAYKSAISQAETAWQRWREGKASSEEPALYAAWQKAASFAASLEPRSASKFLGKG